jgi:WD40 repeat protein
MGDEEGFVTLLDSARCGDPTQRPTGPSKKFGDAHLFFHVHNNAILDLDFSEDDYRLATASGDQTSRVIDVMTQTPIAVLDQHTSSLKQVRFQPGRGQGNVLATSSRDGSIKIWDLRYNGGAVQEIRVGPGSRPVQFGPPKSIARGCAVNTIVDSPGRSLREAYQHSGSTAASLLRLSEYGRVGEASVTALQFMPAGQEHLILSSCEADAAVKLWDVRNIQTPRHRNNVPISFTAEPDSHLGWRPFGISSMSLNTDGTRLYVLCKDNTVYAYSTAHLVLGHAPELTASKGNADPPRRRHGTAQEGLGPLYGFRHPAFHATSFYVKCALRPARDGRSELLAVGSSDGCAVLFPTDERYLQAQDQHEAHLTAANMFDERPGPPPSSAGGRPSLLRTGSFAQRGDDTIPAHRLGTALVRGHSKEVGALAWTHDGKLATVGDDYLVRCWAEDRSRAADLRGGGEAEGRRWNCGWADVGEDFDEDDW